jgi:hypothetical protein
MSEKLENAVRPGLLRILAAIFYDFWLIAAIWLIGTTLDAVIRNALMDHVGDGNYLVLASLSTAQPMGLLRVVLDAWRADTWHALMAHQGC